MTKEARIYNEEKTFYNVAEKTGQSHVKKIK